MSKNERSHRYLLLDGLRGLAAFAVIFHHVPPSHIGDMLPGRYLAVPFFFTLSGFVMAHAYERRLQDGMKPLQLVQRRLIRLYPLYLAGLALGAAMALLRFAEGWSPAPLSAIAVAAALNLAMIPSPALSTLPGFYPFNIPSWSLGFELAINIVYAFLARFLSTRVLAAILAVSAPCLVWMTFQSTAAWKWSGFWYDSWLVIFGFFAGVMIYRINKAKRLPRLPAWLGVVCFMAIIMVPTHGIWRDIFEAIAVVALLPLIVACFANSEVSGATARACGWAGAASYGVYVLHVPLWSVIRLGLDKFGIADLPDWAPGVAVAATATVAALVLDAIYDRPVRRWITARLQPRKPAKASLRRPAAGARTGAPQPSSSRL